MKFLECDLEEIIMKSDFEKLLDKGLWMPNNKKNQVRIGNYGTCDIVAYERARWHKTENGDFIQISKPSINIYELKKDVVSLSSFAQVCRYVKGVQDYFQDKGYDISKYRWRAFLIGRVIDKTSSLIYFPDLFCDHDFDRQTLSIDILQYSYGIDGLTFENINGYGLIDNGFKLCQTGF